MKSAGGAGFEEPMPLDIRVGVGTEALRVI
jgi:hypothetical protein